jgi:Domain of unknown function (DUF4349)
MTHPDDSTATIERDLQAVDAALRAGAADHDDPLAREVQELALALRADAPRADAAFADTLRSRVREGFPPEPGSARARAGAARSSLGGVVSGLPSPRRMLPAAAAFVTVVLIAIGLGSVDLNRSDSDDGGAGGSAAPAPGVGSSEAARSAAPPVPLAQLHNFAPGRRNRRVERSISMTLEAPDEEIPTLAQQVTQVTTRSGGFVLSSSLDSDDEGANGIFELRIPVGRLRAALADLAGLATVRSQSQSGRDVTRRHVTVRDRLDSARAERRSLLRRLEVAETDEEAESIRRRLDLVAGEINGLRALLRDLRLRTDYAVVNVDLAGTDDESGSGGAAGSFDDAMDDAGDLLVGLAGALIRIMAIALPLGLIAAIGWGAARTLRRRRRESVLA